MSINLEGRQSFDPIIWLDEHGDFLYRYALLWTRDSFVAETLIEETLLAAMRSCENQSARRSERTWLKGILRQKLAEHLCRTEKPHELRPAQLADALEMDRFETSGEWREDQAPVCLPVNAIELIKAQGLWETLDHCLSRVPRRAAIVFALREIDGLSREEICELLKMGRDDLQTTLDWIRAKLSRALEDKWLRDQSRHTFTLTGTHAREHRHILPSPEPNKPAVRI